MLPLAEHVDVVDLAWLRVTPWRERLAAHYDPADRRAELRHAVEDLRPPCPGLAALRPAAPRLAVRPPRLAPASSSTRHGDLLRGRARGRRGEVELRLEPVGRMQRPGTGRRRDPLGPRHRCSRSSAARAG